ncbi:MAG: hypothetical protein AAF787_23955, partial [Chloroflexota bacterium]
MLLLFTRAISTFAQSENSQLIDLVESNGNFVDIQINPESTMVVYVTDDEVNNLYEIYSVPIEGGIVTKLNPALGDADVTNFEITPDGTTVVFGVGSRRTF